MIPNFQPEEDERPSSSSRKKETMSEVLLRLQEDGEGPVDVAPVLDKLDRSTLFCPHGGLRLPLSGKVRAGGGVDLLTRDARCRPN